MSHGVRFKLIRLLIKINVVYLLCLFIITVVKALLVFYFNVVTAWLYNPFALCLGFFVYYTSVVANTLVNTDVLPQDV
jgi:hypothetical protein